MLDLHSHVLYGVDDGPRRLEGSLEILRAARDDGIRLIAATPHVRDDHPTSADTMQRLVDELNRLQSGVEVARGGELDIHYIDRLDDPGLRRFGLAGNERVLLVETPYSGLPLDLAERLFALQVRGFTVVLAHPERNGDVQARPERLRALVDVGVLVQLTAASVDGRLGRTAAATSRALLDAGLAHLIASDAHAPTVRAVGMRDAARAVGHARLAEWLTEAVPAAIVRGVALPSRPARRRGTVRLPWHR